MKSTSFLFVLALFSTTALAQKDELLVHGKILDASTGKGIKSSIRYSSIPTESLFGRFNDSTFSFSIFGSAKYQITAQSEGYNAKTVIVDPRDPSSLHRDIVLTPKGQTVILNSLIFAQGKATINPKSYPELDEVAQMMKENQKIVIQLEGHTDNVGSANANMKLSEERVESVKKYLVAQGIAKNRVKTKAFGGTQPLRNEMTPEARAKNRRVEMRILED
ncbi:MAG TPA: OmpA family protein [Cyclobacteriaceae bacterium]|nr:OmpA family protein [Cyclobacteriaceae bacterium]